MLKRISFLLISACALLLFVSACGGSANNGAATGYASSSTVINIVAAENFYGNIAQQLGGNHVNVTSILSDPNVDPHEYEANTQNAIAVAKAGLVIENGGGYDDWMDKLLSASPNKQRQVITAYNIAPRKLPDNEHVWYGIDNIRAIAQAITNALKNQDHADAATFDSNLQKFDQSLTAIDEKMSDIKAKYAGTPVGLTETIFLYQSEPLGLKMLTPFEFQKAVAEGNDPPASAVATTNSQVSSHQIKVLIYNEQTNTPLTTNLQNVAKRENIPVVPVTETMPSNSTYQQWMLGQLTTLEQALQSSK